jgi:cobalt-zinc-cadmium efflux system outer membrane protein
VTRVRGIFHNVTFGATVSVPLWNRNQGWIAAAEAERAGAERTQAARTLAVRAEIAAASARERAARQAVGVYVSGARDLATRNLDIVRESYELGRTRLVDVLVEQRRVLETEMAFTDALGEAYQAHVALLKARGDVR